MFILFFVRGGGAWSCYTETRWHYLIILVLGHCGKNRNNFLEGRTLVWFLLPAFQHQVVAVMLIEINNMYTSNVTSYDGLFFVLSYRTKSSCQLTAAWSLILSSYSEDHRNLLSLEFWASGTTILYSCSLVSFGDLFRQSMAGSCFCHIRLCVSVWQGRLK